MRVTGISVKGLFGIFDHHIPLDGERLTIVFGPNGFGKTVILKMIALVEGSTSIFEHTPFREFHVTFDDGSARIIRRQTEGTAEDAKPQVKLEFLISDATSKLSSMVPSPAASDVPRAVLDRIDRYVPKLRRWRHGWRDNEGNEYTLDWILDRYPKARAALPAKYRPRIFPQDLQVFFVETNRLGAQASTGRRTAVLEEDLFTLGAMQEAQERTSLRVEQYSEDVVHRIKSVLADYAKHSQESDRTFPERLVSFVRGGGKPVLAPRDIITKMAELEKKRQRLISLGFLDQESGLVDLSEEDVRRAPEALTIYVGDVQQKLRVFDDLAERIGRLMDIVNSRFQYKSLTIDREHGFSVLTDSKDSIRLDDLSSGEQHQLVVLYELLFRVPRNGLVLVDEPEISLHVAWQARFLTDLLDILKLTDAYGVVATHSPVIIGDRGDLAVELKGPSAGR